MQPLQGKLWWITGEGTGVATVYLGHCSLITLYWAWLDLDFRRLEFLFSLSTMVRDWLKLTAKTRHL